MCCLLACTRHMIQNPFELGAGEIGIYQQTGFGFDRWCQAARTQVNAGGLGAAVLPDDGVMNGDARFAVPKHRGFTLVGDAQGAHLTRRDASFGQGLTGGGKLGTPDFQRVVLYPAGLRVDLGEFPLRHGNDAPLFVEDNAARTGSALVKCKQIGHGSVLNWRIMGGFVSKMNNAWSLYSKRLQPSVPN